MAVHVLGARRSPWQSCDLSPVLRLEYKAQSGAPSDQALYMGSVLQVATKDEYDKVIQETEAAYLKILESSQTLLTVLKRESINIQKKRQATS